MKRPYTPAGLIARIRAVKAAAQYEIVEVAGYWRLRKDRVLLSTHGTEEEAHVALAKEIAPLLMGVMADKVLAYRVPARTKKAKKRARKRRKVQRESCI